MSQAPDSATPSLESIQLARRRLGKFVKETPARHWQGHGVDTEKPGGATLESHQVGWIACGANVDSARFVQHLERACQ